MSGVLYQYPKQALFGKVLPKNKIYQHARLGSALKERFVTQIEKIIWKYKLAPETVNLPARRSVPEIQIFEIHLKTPDLKNEVLRCIDQAVPFPILYELHYQSQIKLTAAYKRPNDADANKWVVDEYLSYPWLSDNTERIPLPTALDLGSLYEQILRPMIPAAPQVGETLSSQMHRYAQIQKKQNEYRKLEMKLHNEKQFNRKVDINAQIRTIQQELAKLTA